MRPGRVLGLVGVVRAMWVGRGRSVQDTFSNVQAPGGIGARPVTFTPRFEKVSRTVRPCVDPGNEPCRARAASPARVLKRRVIRLPGGTGPRLATVEPRFQNAPRVSPRHPQRRPSGIVPAEDSGRSDRTCRCMRPGRVLGFRGGGSGDAGGARTFGSGHLFECSGPRRHRSPSGDLYASFRKGVPNRTAVRRSRGMNPSVRRFPGMNPSVPGPRHQRHCVSARSGRTRRYHGRRRRSRPPGRPRRPGRSPGRGCRSSRRGPGSCPAAR